MGNLLERQLLARFSRIFWQARGRGCKAVETNCRRTLAIEPVHHKQPLVAVLKALLKRLREEDLPIHCVLLDREFYSVDVILALKGLRLPFLMPMVKKGKKLGKDGKPGGNRAFFARQISGFSRYTITSAAKKKVTVDVVVVCRNHAGKRGKHGREALVYVRWRVAGRPGQIRQLYRRRFGIETSYRQMHQAQIKTTSSDPRWRLFAVGLALLLRNLWIWVKNSSRETLAIRARIDKFFQLQFSLAKRMAPGVGSGCRESRESSGSGRDGVREAGK